MHVLGRDDQSICRKQTRAGERAPRVPISFSLPVSSPSGMWPDLALGFHEIPCILMQNPLAPHPYPPVSQRGLQLFTIRKP